ncbi:MAG: pirin family protein [Caulobacteraceae bacterium]
MIADILQAQEHDLGGFVVGRVLPQPRRRSIGPFVFLDHFGPMEIAAGAPRSLDIRPHPHIGLSTLSYLFEGEITHRDSVGSEALIHPGEVNWMTAGSGITHSERFDSLRRTGGAMHGVQAWVALPDEFEETAPAFSHHGPEDLPTYESPDGLWARLAAGEAFGAKAKVPVHSPMFYVHWRLKAGAKAQLEASQPERAAFVASGEVEAAGERLAAGQMAVFEPGAPIFFEGRSDAEIMLLGGESVGPRYIEWNFVSSSRARIEAAKADWRAGRMKLPDMDHEEFIPLPQDPPPAPSPLG